MTETVGNFIGQHNEAPLLVTTHVKHVPFQPGDWDHQCTQILAGLGLVIGKLGETAHLDWFHMHLTDSMNKKSSCSQPHHSHFSG